MCFLLSMIYFPEKFSGIRNAFKLVKYLDVQLIASNVSRSPSGAVLGKHI